MKKALIITFAVLFSFTATFAQSKREKKMQEAINTLMQTQFIQKYKEYKEIVEVTAGSFKPMASAYDQVEVSRIKFNYETSRAAFDKILLGVKKDLLDKTTREYIVSNPERYTQFVTSELEMAMNNYQEAVVFKINTLTGEQTVGFGIMEVKLLLDLVFDVVGIIQSIQKELDKMSEAYLDEHFTNILKIKSWDELVTGSMQTGSATKGD